MDPTPPGGARRPDRPVVLLCDGPRCRDLHRTGDGSAAERWRAATRAVRGAVLVRTDCLLRCGTGTRACAVVGWRYGEEAAVVAPLTFAGVEDPGTATSLTDWLTTHAAAPADLPFQTLPLKLRAHLLS